MSKKSWWKRQSTGRQFLVIFGGTILLFAIFLMLSLSSMPKDTTENLTPVIKKNVTEEEYVALVKNSTSAASANSALASMTATEYRQGTISQKEAEDSLDKYYWDVYHAYCAVDDVNPPEKYLDSHKSLTRELLVLSNDVLRIRNDVSIGWKDDIIKDLKTLAEDEDVVVNSGNSIM